MRPILQNPMLFSLLLLVGGMSCAGAAVSGSGQPFTALVESSAGILGADADGIWLSTDQGATFANVYSAPGELYFALAVSGSTAVAVGEDGRVLRSADGGTSWQVAGSPPVFGNLLTVASDGDGIWLAAGNDGFDGVILRSTDGGQNWTALAATPAAEGFRAITWQSDAGWILAGAAGVFEGIIYRSTDDGDSWQLLAGGLAAPVNAIAANSLGTITLVGESGLILQGTVASVFTAPDGYSPVSQDLFVVATTQSDSFYVGGEAGSLWSIDNGGAEDISLASGPDLTAILTQPEDGLLISGEYEPPLPQERTIPFQLLISRDTGTGDYILTVMETLSDRNYRIESSTNLQSWSLIEGSERAGNGSVQVWTFPADGVRRFWRAEEL